MEYICYDGYDGCDDGCVLVELALQGNKKILNCTKEQWEEIIEYDYDRREISDSFCDHLEHFKCFKEAVIGYEYGHINYSVASYCVKNGHLNCLKYLHQNTQLQWHNDLAVVAIENSQLLCLKYIVEFMGDYKIYDNYVCSNNECIEYISNLKVNQQIPKIL